MIQESYNLNHPLTVINSVYSGMCVHITCVAIAICLDSDHSYIFFDINIQGHLCHFSQLTIQQ